MEDPFKDLEKDITNIIRSAVKNSPRNGVLNDDALDVPAMNDPSVEDSAIEGAGAEGVEDAPRKKTGGQPGNKNAVKHGLYAKALTPEQQDAFPTALETQFLNQEIAVMRLKMAALMAEDGVDFNLVVRGMGTLTRMVRIEERIRYGS